MLMTAAMIWGSTMVAQSMGMDHIGPMTFQTARSILGIAFLLPVIYLFDSNKQQYFHNWKQPELWRTGLICGIALFAAASLLQVGIIYTTAGKAGFITSMQLLLVPILGIFLGRRPSYLVWICVGIATVGLYLISCAGVERINIGDLLLLLGAFAFAVQITLIDRLAIGLDGLRVNCIQTLVCGVLAAIAMVLTETVDFGSLLACWPSVAYAGILSTGVAYSLQILGQKHLDPTPASLIMSLESVFAALSGWLVLKERMSVNEAIGCALVFGAVILSQIPIQKSHD